MRDPKNGEKSRWEMKCGSWRIAVHNNILIKGWIIIQVCTSLYINNDIVNDSKHEKV